MLRFATADLDDEEELEKADAKVKKRVAQALGEEGGSPASPKHPQR